MEAQCWITFDHEPTLQERNAIDQTMVELGYVPSEPIEDGEHGYEQNGKLWQQSWEIT